MCWEQNPVVDKRRSYVWKINCYTKLLYAYDGQNICKELIKNVTCEF